MARKAKDEIEVVFGFKHVFGLVFLIVAIVGAAFFWGFETGHKRALRGDPSLLTFLEKQADTHTEPVRIPDILFEQLDEDRAKAKASGETAARSPNPPIERVKPKAGVQPEAVAEAKRLAAPAATPAPKQAAPAAPRPTKAAADARLHYQVAALKVRKNAKGLVDWLRTQGFPAQIHPASDDGLFRVLVGPFGHDQDAESAKQRLAKDGFAVMARRF